MLRLIFLALLLCLILAGCAGNTGPSQVIVQYLQARVASDVDKLRSLSCSDWEPQAILEADSFQGRNAKLQDVACQEDGKDGDYTIVSCTGKIVVTYQGESNQIPISSYRTIQEDGEWKMCGEAG